MATTAKPNRRPRDPAATREAILEASSRLLAKDGPEGISLSQVAHAAEVNRGTAYQHFETRENLIQATVDWASDKLFRAAFGDPETLGERQVEQVDTMDLTERIAVFAMANPELCRVWLMQVIGAPDPSKDMFWREYQGSFQRFADSELATPGIDTEVLSVMMLAGLFLWPMWAQAHADDPATRTGLAKRFARECLRMSLHGTMKPERFPELVRDLASGQMDGEVS
ncbi:MAG: TetR/AcrR family transcriptional regulator [Sphingomonadales bacterium]|nr:TetR/AcrR family transcriptional regulator [Sphingomonadales bacterium]